MADRPKRTTVPPVRFKDYAQMDSTSSEGGGPISKPQALAPMSESLSNLRSALGVLRNETMEQEFQSCPSAVAEQSQQLGAVPLAAKMQQFSQQTGLGQQGVISSDQANVEEERRQQAELPRLEEERRQQAELARLEEERRQQAELARLEEERRQQAEFARLEEERRKQAEFARLEEERRHQADLIRLEEERRQQVELIRLNEETRKQAELVRLEEERRKQAELIRLNEETRQQAELVRLEEETRQQAELVRMEEDRRQQAELFRMEKERRQQAELVRIEEDKRRQAELVRLEAERRALIQLELDLERLDGDVPREANCNQQEDHFRQRRKELNRPEGGRSGANNRNNIGVCNSDINAFRIPGNGNEVVPIGPESRLTASTVNFELLTQLLQSIRDAQRDHHEFCVNQFRHINSRIDRIAGLIEREPEFPTKPDSLPMTSRQNIEEFESASDEEFRKIVHYLAELGGFNLNETANFIVKNAIDDSLSPSLTWQGREPGTMKLQETKLANAFYAAAAKNKAFPKPAIKEFMEAMSAALKSSKQRNRNRQRVAANRRPRDEDPAERDRQAQRRRLHDDPAG